MALDSLEDLRAEFDVVICEGAGSPAEINLRDTDIANMGLARAANLPVIVVGDIDRGGVFASFFGTVALLHPADQALVWVRDQQIPWRPQPARPGLRMLRELTGRPSYGVLPWRDGLALDMEDSLALDRAAGTGAAAGFSLSNEVLRVSVLRLPRISNFTDVDALAAEPGVLVRFATAPAELADADLVIIPGTRATVADLAWLRERGFAAVITERARRGLPVLGVCGGYQMLAREIDDPVESGAGVVAGLGLLPATVRFGPGKVLGAGRVGLWRRRHRLRDSPRDRLGRAGRGTVSRRLPGGRRMGHHVAWDPGERSLPAGVPHRGGRAGRAGFTVAPATDFAAVRQARLDTLGDLVVEHLDTEALCSLIEHGPRPGLPVIPPAGVG